MTTRLLNPVEPKADESPHGYYRRLAQENHFFSWSDLARAVGGSAAISHLFSSPKNTAAVLGLDPKWTIDLTKKDKEQQDLERFLRRGNDAVCPECLKNGNYIRSHWQHAYVTACSKHGLVLIDTCDHCGEKLSQRRPVIERCGCGRCLTEIAPDKALPGALWLSSVLARVPPKRRAAEPKFKLGSVLEFSQRIQTLCELYDVSRTSLRRNGAAPQSVIASIEFLHPLEDLLHNWPANFHAHVHARLDAAPSSSRTLNAALGLWYTRLKRHSINELDEPFLAETLKAVSNKSSTLLGLDGAAKSPILPKVSSLRDAATRLGVRRDALAEAIEAKKVTARTSNFGARCLRYQLDEAEVLRLESARQNWVDEKTAKALLEVPDAALANLKACGAIEWDGDWRSDICKSGPINRKSVTALVEKLRESVRPVAADVDTITLADLNSRRIGDKKALTAVFTAIASGELQGVGKLPPKGIGKIHFLLQEVTPIFRDTAAGGWSDDRTPVRADRMEVREREALDRRRPAEMQPDRLAWSGLQGCIAYAPGRIHTAVHAIVRSCQVVGNDCIGGRPQVQSIASDWSKVTSRRSTQGGLGSAQRSAAPGTGRGGSAAPYGCR